MVTRTILIFFLTSALFNGVHLREYLNNISILEFRLYNLYIIIESSRTFDNLEVSNSRLEQILLSKYGYF